MLKKIVFAALFAVLTTATAWAAGPAQMWRLDITGSESGAVEIAEMELRETAGGASVVDLFRNFTFEESAPAGAATWTITHSLGIQVKTAGVDVIAYAVDVVAPGDHFFIMATEVLSVRTALAYEEVEYTSGDTASRPASPVDGQKYYNTQLGYFEYWNDTGGTWDPLVYSTVTALPIPDEVEPDTVTWLPSGALPAAGGPARNDAVEITFLEPVVGGATVTGASFDTPSTNRPGDAVPVIEGFERRPGAAVFDGNKASKFVSKRAPTFRSPLTVQYTFWVGDQSRYPNVVEYTITAPKKLHAPKSWTLMMYKDGQWVAVDQQAAMRFEDGETRVFSID